jgi:biopolymer transport protein ExbD
MRIRKRSRLRSRERHLADLSMTPLIDVALTLLIMFMVTTPIMHNAIKVTLPKGNVQESAKDDSRDVVVYIDHSGNHYINNVKVEKNNLVETLKQNVSDVHNGSEKKVYVKADTAVSYGTVLELVDDIKFIGGINYVALATQKNIQKNHTAD